MYNEMKELKLKFKSTNKKQIYSNKQNNRKTKQKATEEKYKE